MSSSSLNVTHRARHSVVDDPRQISLALDRARLTIARSDRTRENTRHAAPSPPPPPPPLLLPSLLEMMESSHELTLIVLIVISALDPYLLMRTAHKDRPGIPSSSPSPLRPRSLLLLFLVFLVIVVVDLVSSERKRAKEREKVRYRSPRSK